MTNASVMKNEWFELGDIQEQNFERKIWTPLWQSEYLISEGKSSYAGYKNEFVSSYLIAFPLDKKSEALKLDWHSIQASWGHGPYKERGNYLESGLRYNILKGCHGLSLGLEQGLETEEHNSVILHQDVMFSLNLVQQGDVWINPREDDIEVVKLNRDEKGAPVNLLIRTNYLRDYLSARDMGALIGQYIERVQINANDPECFDKRSEFSGESFHGEILTVPIHEGNGMGFGEKVHILEMTRENTNYEEDLPEIQASKEEDHSTNSYSKAIQGAKVYRTMGAIWINSWLEPLDNSFYVLEEKEGSKAFFKVDAAGTEKSGVELEVHDGWLCFRPDLILEILKRRLSSLSWYTADTGQVSFLPGEGFHFGVNSKGFVNVLAVDVYRLSDFHRKILSSFSVSPDGPVSKELLMSQKDGNPAGTYSPEFLLNQALEYLDFVNLNYLDKPIVREHSHTVDILIKCHRFTSLNKEGFFSLAKELTRLFIERLDKTVLIEMTDESKRHKNKDIGSIKALETYLASVGLDGRKFTAPFVGCNELRQFDSHLPSETDQKYLDALKLVEIDSALSFQEKGRHLIGVMQHRIGYLAKILEEGKKS